MKKFWQEIKPVLFIFLIWRILLFAVGFVGQYLIPFKFSFPYVDQILMKSNLPQWLWQWGNFDGVHYLYLAAHGYASDGLHVFFPLYPILIKLFGGNIISALLVSNISIILCGYLLFKMAKNWWPVIFLFCFPTSFFFGAIYTESVFLLFVLSTFYFKNYIFAFLAGLTRLVGVAMGPLAWIGLVVYVLFLNFVYHRPLAFIESQAAFNNARASSLGSLVTPPQVIWRYFKIFTTANPANFDFWLAVLEFSAFGFGFGFLLWATIKRKYPLTWLIFCWLALLMPVASGTFSSMPRYLLAIFPIFLALGNIKHRNLKLVILGIFVILQITLTVLFTSGYFVS